jgi:ABC-2 type transport system ATP-binding protein
VSLIRRETHRIHALDHVSFTLRRGEFAAYAGPNGAGKSTTFKLLSGMLRPQEGTVRLFGLDPSTRRIDVMRRTGILFGNRSELWWDHPIRASFEWKKAVWNVDDVTYRRVTGEMRELLDIGEIWNGFARELSLGQRMRANLALTLLHDPELVLLDEPTLGLDVLAKRQMIDFLKRINREKQVTLLVTSHDMDDLTEMANRILLINQGRLAFDGGYDELIRMAGDSRIIKLTLRGNSPMIGHFYVLEDPDRVVLDLAGNWQIEVPKVPSNRLIGAVRVGQHEDKTRLVFDMKNPGKAALVPLNRNALELRIQ